ncbi:MAG: hypothetical protein ABIH35_04715 [Patescibacteria group bacterium]
MIDFAPTNWIKAAGKDLNPLPQSDGKFILQNPNKPASEKLIRVATPELLLKEHVLTGRITLAELSNFPEKLWEIWEYLDSEDAGIAEFQTGELEMLKGNFEIPGKIAGIKSLLKEIDDYNRQPPRNIDKSALGLAVQELEKRIFALDKLVDPNLSWEVFLGKIEASAETKGYMKFLLNLFESIVNTLESKSRPKKQGRKFLEIIFDNPILKGTTEH